MKKRVITILLSVVVIALLLVFTPVLVLKLTDTPLSEVEPGEFADMYGMLNVFAVTFALIAVLLQSKELKATRRELAMQTRLIAQQIRLSSEPILIVVKCEKVSDLWKMSVKNVGNTVDILKIDFPSSVVADRKIKVWEKDRVMEWSYPAHLEGELDIVVHYMSEQLGPQKLVYAIVCGKDELNLKR